MSLYKLRWLFWIGLSHFLLATAAANENIRPVGKVSLAEAETVTSESEAAQAGG